MKKESILTFLCIHWPNFSSKENFTQQLLGFTGIQSIQERQDKCLIVSLYLPVSRIISWFPSILQGLPFRGFFLCGFFFLSHYKLIDSNILGWPKRSFRFFIRYYGKT